MLMKKNKSLGAKINQNGMNALNYAYQSGYQRVIGILKKHDVLPTNEKANCAYRTY